MRLQRLDLDRVKQYVDNKKIICFGCGQQGSRMVCLLDNWNRADQILAFTDNNEKMWGKSIQHFGHSYPVISLAESFDLWNDHTEIVYIITCLDWVSVKKQMDEQERLNDVDCLCLTDIATNQLCVSDYKNIMHEAEDAVIPKMIHYCWFGDEMPRKLKKNIEQWHTMCPDYEIIEWNERNLDLRENDYVKQAAEMKKWAYVSDYFRLAVIARHGGIYLDTDIEVIKKPDELLYQEGFMCFDGTLLVNTGSGFGAKRNNELIGELKNYYDKLEFIDTNGSIDTRSCMVHTYQVMKKYGIQLDDHQQKIKGINIYPMIFQGTNGLARKIRVTDKTFFAHYGTLSWVSDRTRKVYEQMGSFGDYGLKNY